MKDKRIFILIFVLILVVGLCIFGFSNISKDGKKKENSTSEKTKKKKNTSTNAERFFETKETDKYEISNIYINKDEDKKVILVADFKNITKTTIFKTKIDLVIIGAENKEIGRVPTTVKKIKPNEVFTVKADISEYYDTALDFEVEIRK